MFPNGDLVATVDSLSGLDVELLEHAFDRRKRQSKSELKLDTERHSDRAALDDAVAELHSNRHRHGVYFTSGLAHAQPDWFCVSDAYKQPGRICDSHGQWQCRPDCQWYGYPEPNAERQPVGDAQLH